MPDDAMLQNISAQLKAAVQANDLAGVQKVIDSLEGHMHSQQQRQQPQPQDKSRQHPQQEQHR